MAAMSIVFCISWDCVKTKNLWRKQKWWCGENIDGDNDCVSDDSNGDCDADGDDNNTDGDNDYDDNGNAKSFTSQVAHGAGAYLRFR